MMILRYSGSVRLKAIYTERLPYCVMRLLMPKRLVELIEMMDSDVWYMYVVEPSRWSAMAIAQWTTTEWMVD